eukprot:g12281.t1
MLWKLWIGQMQRYRWTRGEHRPARKELGQAPQGNRAVLFGKPHFTMPSIESAYLNLNLYANTNPNFQRNVIEKMMAISKKDAKFISNDESILVKSVLNSFEVFGKFPAKMRDIISRDIQVLEYMPGDVLCTYGEKASSAILILNGKVNLFRPFKAKTFEVKESAKLKRNSSSDFFDEMSQGSSILQNSGTVMDLGTKVNCEDISFGVCLPCRAREYIMRDMLLTIGFVRLALAFQVCHNDG